MKLCPRCGYLAQDDANFCPRCGYPLTPQASTQQEPLTNPQQPTAQPYQPPSQPASPYGQPPQPPYQPPYLPQGQPTNPNNQPQQPPYQLPYLPQQQPTKERKFPIIPVIGAVVATLVILVVIVAVVPSLFSSSTYVVQPSFLSSHVGGSWHVDENKTFTITISDSKAVVSFANGTTLTSTDETAFVEYLDSYNLNFNLGNQQIYEPTSTVTPEELVSSISTIKFEVLNSSDNQYAVALFVKFVPNSYYANELGKIVNLLPSIAGLSTIDPNITAYYNSTYNAIGIEQPSFNGYYNVAVVVINVNSLEVGAMVILINHQISYSQLEDLVNSFAELIGS